MGADLSLHDLRARIDALDTELQTLIRERARIAQRIAERKRAGGEDGNYYRPEREAAVLNAVQTRDSAPLAAEDMTRLFREIMSACRALEGPLAVAYLGPEGTYSEAAVLKHFGTAVSGIPVPRIADIFRHAESETAHYGVVPAENSGEGSINDTLDLLQHTPLKICGEIQLRIRHCLLARAGEKGTIQNVYAHPQALAQCRAWLDAELPHATRTAVTSNAEAARRAGQDNGVAAIAGAQAAERYSLDVLAQGIEDRPDNTTRFLVLGREEIPPCGTDKTSLILSVQNRPGALHQALEPLARLGISMTRIESRPSRRGMWDYVFFIDLQGHRQQPMLAEALGALAALAAMLKVLGSYPVAIG